MERGDVEQTKEAPAKSEIRAMVRKKTSKLNGKNGGGLFGNQACSIVEKTERFTSAFTVVGFICCFRCGKTAGIIKAHAENPSILANIR